MSSSSIVQRTYSSVLDTKISLLGSNVARVHNISTWKTIRIAIRGEFGVCPGTTITGSPIFALGLCSGQGVGSLLFDSTTQHFVGVYSNGAQFTFSNSGFSYSYYTVTLTSAKKVGTTWTGDAGTTSTHFFSASGETQTRTLLFVEITKGSPNYTINYFTHNSLNGAFTDPSATQFLEQIELPTPVFADHAWTNGSVAVNESNDGVLDNVLVAWNGTPQTFEISDIAVCRIA